MKNICLVASLCLSCLCLNGQSTSVENFCNAFQDSEVKTHIQLKGRALQLAANYTEDEDSEKVLGKVLQLRVLAVENQYLNGKKNYRGLIQQLKKDDFSTLMKVKEDALRLEFLIKEYENVITDVVAIVRTKDDFVLLSLEGLLDFSDLNDLQFQLDGGSYFKKIPEKRSDIPQA